MISPRRRPGRSRAESGHPRVDDPEPQRRAQRHRDQTLLHHPDSPQLPGGYAAMFVLALCPPLWFRIVDPRVAAFRTRTAGPATR